MGQYEKEANEYATKHGVKLTVIDSEYKKHFADDKQPRMVFKMCLKRGRKQYTFNFGQSIAAGGEEPTMYSILSCMQKYDVGSFDDFCGDFGYDTDSRTAERIYKAVCKEYAAMCRLFNERELELMQEIQ